MASNSDRVFSSLCVHLGGGADRLTVSCRVNHCRRAPAGVFATAGVVAMANRLATAPKVTTASFLMMESTVIPSLVGNML